MDLVLWQGEVKVRKPETLKKIPDRRVSWGPHPLTNTPFLPKTTGMLNVKNVRFDLFWSPCSLKKTVQEPELMGMRGIPSKESHPVCFAITILTSLMENE